MRLCTLDHQITQVRSQFQNTLGGRYFAHLKYVLNQRMINAYNHRTSFNMYDFQRFGQPSQAAAATHAECPHYFAQACNWSLWAQMTLNFLRGGSTQQCLCGSWQYLVVQKQCTLRFVASRLHPTIIMGQDHLRQEAQLGILACT